MGRLKNIESKIDNIEKILSSKKIINKALESDYLKKKISAIKMSVDVTIKKNFFGEDEFIIDYQLPSIRIGFTKDGEMYFVDPENEVIFSSINELNLLDLDGIKKLNEIKNIKK